MSVAEVERSLRHSEPAVIARINDSRVVIDLRTVSEAEEAELINALAALA
jgi:hypothetical protein